MAIVRFSVYYSGDFDGVRQLITAALYFKSKGSNRSDIVMAIRYEYGKLVIFRRKQ